MNSYNNLCRVTMKHRGGAGKYTVDIAINGEPAVVTSHYFTFADPRMDTEGTFLCYVELATVLDVVDAYKRARVWIVR